ncbi:helix-turn-helix domain-containing protein [Streptomyces hokutonensis]|uniref:helix-turn-helix domain-containing protein n=1 Tax=Streptomyces hokutonensis TaxID=1306990 RepID=UPI003806DD29
MGLLTPCPLPGRVARRVVLEAKRLLARGDPPASRAAAQLGFTGATNFSKFFHQRIGHSPVASRATVRRRSSEDGQAICPVPGDLAGEGRACKGRHQIEPQV